MLLGFILLMGLSVMSAWMLTGLMEERKDHFSSLDSRARQVEQRKKAYLKECARRERVRQLQRKAERQDNEIDEIDQQLEMFTFDIEKLKQELDDQGYAINPPASDLEIELEIGPAAAITLNARLIETIQELWDKAEAEANRDPRSWSDKEVATWETNALPMPSDKNLAREYKNRISEELEVRTWDKQEPLKVKRPPRPSRHWDW